MLGSGQISEILALYGKHGWNLRRVLLSAPLRSALGNSLATLFGDADIRDSEIDAVWFSRPPKGDQEIWELRRLSETPFALNEFFDVEDDDDVREETLLEVESRLINSNV